MAEKLRVVVVGSGIGQAHIRGYKSLSDRFHLEGLTAESHTQPHSATSHPWTFTPDTPEIGEQIDRVLGRFEPLPEGFAGQFLRFHQALSSGEELPVTLSDARASLELITALYYSAETGQPVGLPIGNAHPRYSGWQPK